MENAPSASDNPASARQRRGATDVLRDILDDLEATAAAEHEDNTKPDEDLEAHLGDVLDRLDERAYGFLLLLLALPCCLPFVYLLPQIVALPMLALAGQLAAGRHHPWLPRALHNRSFSISAFRSVLNRADKYIGWVEKLARPRLRVLTSGVGARLTGALLIVPTASILVPLPSTNTVPGIGVAIASLGFIERDGLLVITGLVIGFVWVGLLLFLGVEASQLIKDWVSTRL